MGKIVSLNISRKTGTIKQPVPSVELIAAKGIIGDAHAGRDHRQVSLMMLESIEEQKARVESGNAEPCPEADEKFKIGPGIYAENLTTQGIDLLALKIGDELLAGDSVLLRVSQIGKECHTRCQIYYKVGDCIMPRQGIFCEVVRGGMLRAGDGIERN